MTVESNLKYYLEHELFSGQLAMKICERWSADWSWHMTVRKALCFYSWCPAMKFWWDCVVRTLYQEFGRFEGWPFLGVINTLTTDNLKLQLKSSNTRQHTTTEAAVAVQRDSLAQGQEMMKIQAKDYSEIKREEHLQHLTDAVAWSGLSF